VVVRMQFEDFVGRFVYHCHILPHEDTGMMGTVEVVDPNTPPFHLPQYTQQMSAMHPYMRTDGLT
jgi:multicopper oxidase